VEEASAVAAVVDSTVAAVDTAVADTGKAFVYCLALG
jgi:hypothetical protein